MSAPPPPGAMPSPEPTLVGRTLAGGVQVLNELGSSTDGRLYAARYPTGLPAVVLSLRPQRDAPELSRAFGLQRRKEQFQRATQIQHSNVAAVYEVGETEEGTPYVVLEHLEGELLANMLARSGAVPLRQAVELCLQAAAGLEAAHRAGFIHGSLSPRTILVTPGPGGGFRIKLIRFPLDAPSRQVATHPLDEATAPYASPERLDGRGADVRSDVFSLGAVLHHLLTGAPPGPRADQSTVPQVMRAVLDRALATDPRLRFPTVAELAVAIERAAAAPAQPERRRRKGLIALAAAASVAVAVGVAMWQLKDRWQPPGVVVTPTAPLPSASAGGRASPPLAPKDTAKPPSKPAARSTGSPDSSARFKPTRSARANSSAKDTATTRGQRAESRPGAAKPAAPPADTAPQTARRSPGRELDEPAETGAAPPVAPATGEPELDALEQRAGIYRRVGLDEASRQLGAPIHAIEGMSPLFVGFTQGRLSPGADTTRPIVRAVYLDPNGRLILLDQQRILSEHGLPPVTWNPRRIRNVVVYLHGEVPQGALRGIAKRVR